MDVLSVLGGLMGAIVSPERCSSCDERVRLGRAFCPACAAAIEPPPEGGDPRATAAGAFGGPLARAIHRLKYEQRPDLSRPLGDLLARAGERWASEGVEAVVPVPLGDERLIERGYNQAALLAARAARAWGARHEPLALARAKRTGQLAKQARDERFASVSGAFVAARPEALSGRRVVLVDDVITTGATLGDAARCARDAGAVVVGLAVVAMVERLFADKKGARALASG